VLPFVASGTGGLEAALVNICSPGDKVVAVCGGAFGDRFAAIAEAFGLAVSRVDVPWGKAADPEAVRAALRATPGARAVLITHNETSTGVRNDLAAIAGVAREFPVLIVVDAISSLGAIDLRTDEWELDVVITGSQKALMAPPGLALLSVSERAWEASKAARLPRFYWSFERLRTERLNRIKGILNAALDREPLPEATPPPATQAFLFARPVRAGRGAQARRD